MVKQHFCPSLALWNSKQNLSPPGPPATRSGAPVAQGVQGNTPPKRFPPKLIFDEIRATNWFAAGSQKSENPPEKRNFTSADPLFGSEAAIGPWKVTATAMRPEAVCGDL